MRWHRAHPRPVTNRDGLRPDPDLVDALQERHQSELARIAHQICCDASEVSADDIRNIAVEAVERQRALLMAGLTRVIESLEEQLRQNDRRPSEEQMSLLLSGSGIPVIRRHLAESKLTRSWQRVMSLEEMAGKSVAGAACAFAVARLAHDLCRDDLLKTYQPLSSGEISPD